MVEKANGGTTNTAVKAGIIQQKPLDLNLTL
nr:MAG TPA: hypothetical protein [Caudoviricetes sp.]